MKHGTPFMIKSARSLFFAAAAVSVFIFNPVCAAQSVIRGVVVSESGAPVSRAKVVLLHSRRYEPGIVAGRAAAKSDGTFEISGRELPLSSIPTTTYLIGTSGELLGIELVRNPRAMQRIVCGPRASVSGTVRDSEGRPVEGAVVEPASLYRDGFFGRQRLDCENIRLAVRLRRVTTDAQGRFTLAGLPSGWDVRLRARRGSSEVGESEAPKGTPSFLVSERAVPAGASDVVIALRKASTSPTGRIKGRVLDSSTQRAVRGIVVMASSEHSKQVSTAVSRPDGSFELDGLSPGTYYVWVLEADKPVQPETDVLVRENETAEVTLYAIEGTKVAGRVLDAESELPLGGVSVFAPGSRPVITGRDGCFSIRILPGPGILTTLASGYIQLNCELDVPETGAVTGLTLKLSPDGSGRLYGRVKDSTGKPVNSALVRVVTEDGPSNTIQADSDGRYEYTFERLGPRAARCVLIAYDPVTNAGAVRHLNLVMRNTSRADVILRPAASVSGLVVNADGEPISGAEIIPMLQAGRHRIYSLHNRAQSDASGGFEIEGLIPNARYSIRIEAEGYGPPCSELVEPVPPGQDGLPTLSSGKTTRVKFVLPRAD